MKQNAKGGERMKIKYKIIAVFILSILISVIVFLAITYGLLNEGYFSGLTSEDMNEAIEQVVEDIKMKSNLSQEEIEDILEKAHQEYPLMHFEILKDEEMDRQIIKEVKNTAKISIQELIVALSNNGEYQSTQWVVARPIMINEEIVYLLNSVDRADFKTITYYFNGPRARGVLGNIVLLGLTLTCIISSLCTYLFLRNTMKRVKQIYDGMNEFKLGNLTVRIEDKQKDEINQVAISFNEMATQIEEQIRGREEYEEKKRKLLSNISHDLRTPLSSVIGYSELLLGKEEEQLAHSEEAKKYIEIINRKAIYMEKLLGELIELSKIESGDLKLQLHQGDIVECMREILIEYLPAIDREEIQLDLDLPEEPISIAFDQERMERVLRNLLDNALKYGMEGKRLNICMYKETEWAMIEIQDFGVGMDEKTQQHIFERFYRGEKARGTKSGGMGLGLAISQEIIKQHGGDITIISKPQQGTKIVIKLLIHELYTENVHNSVDKLWVRC